jgi:prevent-host-death family protein
MKTVTAREANQNFSRLLAEAEAGQEIAITRRGKAVATLGPYQRQLTGAEREAALSRVLEMMRNAPKLGTARRFSRDELHER